MMTGPVKLPAKKAKAPKRFIKSTVTVHDRTQFETVFDYFLYRGRVVAPDAGVVTGPTVKIAPPTETPRRVLSAVKRPPTLSYKVDAFFFYPRQFGLNDQTYKKERFFSDVRPMLRFREPKLGFKTMIGQKRGALSPLVFLRDFLRDFLKNAGDGLTDHGVQHAVDETRLFACSFIGTYLRGIDRIRRRILSAVATAGPEGLAPAELDKTCLRMNRLLDRAVMTLREFQNLVDSATKQNDPRIKAWQEELSLVDEYCCYRLVDGISFLIRAQERLGADPSVPGVVTLHEAVLRVLAENQSRCASRGYMQMSAASSTTDKERFIHRRNELKRRIWAILFLELRARPLFALQQQIGAMTAAGLAAAWAVFAQFLLVQKMMKPESVADSVGVSGLLLFSAGILAYVIKDRIKDIGKSYFGGGLFRRIPDHSERIYYKNRTGDPTEVGFIQERARFISVDTLPAQVLHLRNTIKDAKIYGETSIPQVLHYAKSVTLSGKLRILNRYPLRAVHDIMRMNVDACLPQLGEASRTLDVATVEGGVDAVRFPKVYYLDMVLSYSQLGQEGAEEKNVLDYFRLVLDKTGLLRIERLN